MTVVEPQNINNNMLELSPIGYFRMFDAYRILAGSDKEAFEMVYNFCERKGYSHRYSCYESFQRVYYRAVKKKKV